MQQNTQSRRRILIIVLGLMVVVSLCLFLFKQHTTRKNIVNITNLTSCTKDIAPVTAQKLETSIYGFVTTTNQFNNAKNSSAYTGSVRNNTCHTQYNSSSQHTSFVLDIPKAKQSWNIAFNWITSSQPQTDLGGIVPSCLADKDLAYGNFNCTSVINLLVPPTTQNDPILAHLPHSTLDYTLSATTDSNGKVIVTAQLFLTEADQSDPTAAVAQYKQEVTDYITSIGLNPADYNIQYTY